VILYCYFVVQIVIIYNTEIFSTFYVVSYILTSCNISQNWLEIYILLQFFERAHAITLSHVRDGTLPPFGPSFPICLIQKYARHGPHEKHSRHAFHRKECSTLTRVSTLRVMLACCLLQDNKSDSCSPRYLTSPLLGFACQQRGHFHFIGR